MNLFIVFNHEKVMKFKLVVNTCIVFNHEKVMKFNHEKTMTFNGKLFHCI